MRKILFILLLAIPMALFSQKEETQPNFDVGGIYGINTIENTLYFRCDSWYNRAFAYEVNGKQKFRTRIPKHKEKCDGNYVKVGFGKWSEGEYVIGVEKVVNGKTERLLLTDVEIYNGTVKVTYSEALEE